MRRHLTFANIVSLIALFVALGGGAYATLRLPRNSVRSGTIRDGQVKNADLATSAVTSSKVRAGSLESADTNLQWALVSKAGAIKEQSGGIAVKQDSSGELTMDFGRSLLGRSIQVTPVFSGKDVSPGPFGAWASVAICGAPTTTDAVQIKCDTPYNSARFAVVATFTASSSSHVPHSFMVTAF
ncbi:MAG: hypothetical protein ACRDLL_02365 [Solirubrobacterales bacterium]